MDEIINEAFESLAKKEREIVILDVEIALMKEKRNGAIIPDIVFEVINNLRENK